MSRTHTADGVKFNRSWFAQLAAMPSPPTVFSTVTEPVAVRETFALILYSSTFLLAPVWT